MHEIIFEGMQDDLWELLFSNKNFENNAIETSHRTIKFKELQEKVFCFSQRLHLKLRGHTVIALYFERDIEYIIAVLSSIYLNVTFVPIDIYCPKLRVQYILEKANISIVLTNQKNSSILSNFENYKIINVFELMKEETYLLPENLERRDTLLLNNNLAYILFTSGTTGNPKGVMVSRKNLLYFLKEFQKKIKIGPSDVLLSNTTFSFDISLLEILIPILNGGTIFLTNRREQLDFSKINDIILEKNITCAQGTPSFWESLLDVGWKNETNIKILCGGEKLSDRLYEILGTISEKAYNLYGPTETTIWTSISRINSKITQNIGMPFEGTTFSIDGEEEGELIIEGPGVTEGYIGDEKQTENSFSENNLSGNRYYRTGDIVKKEGSKYIFLGRNDSQVKLNGFRINLSEIDNNILRLKEVKNSKTFLIEKKIFSVVISNLDSNKILYFLNNILPYYMIPRKIISLDSFPLNVNGKIDFNYLKELARGSINSEVDLSKNIFELGLSSLEVMDILQNKENQYIDFRKLFLGEPLFKCISDEIPDQSLLKNNYNGNTNNLNRVQHRLLLHSKFYPSSDLYYSNILFRIKASNIKFLDLYNCLTQLLNNIEVFKHTPKFSVKGSYYKQSNNYYIHPNILSVESDINLGKQYFFESYFCLDNNNKLNMRWIVHHSILDGLSLFYLIELFYRMLKNEVPDYSIYNNFLDTVTQINNIEGRRINLDRISVENRMEHDFLKNNQYKKAYIHLDKSRVRYLKLLSKNIKVPLSILLQFYIMKSFRDEFRMHNYCLVDSRRQLLTKKTRKTLGCFFEPKLIKIDYNDIDQLKNFAIKVVDCMNDDFYNITDNDLAHIDTCIIINYFDTSKYENLFHIDNEYFYEKNNFNININILVSDVIKIYITSNNGRIDIEKLKKNINFELDKIKDDII